MSRTFHDAPAWVRRARTHATELHDHTDGPCDLPPRDAWVEMDRDRKVWAPGQRCRWHADPYSPLLLCNCGICGTYTPRPLKRRTARRAAAQLCRDIAAGHVDADDAVFDPARPNW